MSDWTVIGSITLAAVPESVGEARHFAAEVLANALGNEPGDAAAGPGDRPDDRRGERPGDRERVGTAELLISEACTNSVVHSRSRFGGKFTLTLLTAGGTLRCEIVDQAGHTVPTRREDGGLRDNGYGVMLIETLADRSGHFTEGGQLNTWFEID